MRPFIFVIVLSKIYFLKYTYGKFNQKKSISFYKGVRLIKINWEIVCTSARDAQMLHGVM